MGTNVYVETYGCTLNQADSDTLVSTLHRGGIGVVNEEEAAVIIVNTCTVKRPTEQKILHRLGDLEKARKNIIVTGCMASANRDLVEKVAPNASIVTASNIGRIVEVIEGATAGEKKLFTDYKNFDRVSLFAPSKNVIARVQINDGCASLCSFCGTKFARGPLHSFSEELILNAIHMSVNNGAKEIQLASQDAGAYGLDKKTNIAVLALRASQFEGDFRMRIGMLNPEHLHRYFDELVDALKQKKVYKFLHLPVQSGSNKVLKEMNRRYTVEEFRYYVDALKKEIPGISIETDLIVGYPTETNEDFERSLDLIEEIKPVVVNVSRFGVRPHTKAAKLKQLNNGVIKERSVRMHRVARRVEQSRGDSCIGEVERVLITERHGTRTSGRDNYYRQIGLVNGNANLGEFLDARIVGNSYACLLASLI